MKNHHWRELTQRLAKTNRQIKNVKDEIEKYQLFQRLCLDMDFNEVETSKVKAYRLLDQLYKEKRCIILGLRKIIYTNYLAYKLYIHYIVQCVIFRKKEVRITSQKVDSYLDTLTDDYTIRQEDVNDKTIFCIRKK